MYDFDVCDALSKISCFVAKIVLVSFVILVVAGTVLYLYTSYGINY